MYANSIGRPSASAAQPIRCTRCDRTFKRLEHLRRHERVHDNKKHYACKQCSKHFTRSDVLHRHEATHTAVAQCNSTRTVGARACTECARSRERCTKTDPCQRCVTKGLRCVYPQAQASGQHQRSASHNSSVADGSLGTAPQVLVHHDHMHQDLSPSRLTASFVDPSLTDVPNTFASSQATVPCGISQYNESQTVHPTMDYPLNWLPPDNSIAIDYDSIVGWGIGSLDFFSLPDPSQDITGNDNIASQDLAQIEPPQVRSTQNENAASRDMHASSHDHRVPWNNMAPEIYDSNASSGSPRSVAYAVSPSSAPGGLYATSFNGARMPCTIRARRAQRLLPGASPIRPLTCLTSHGRFNLESLNFPDTSHIVVDDGTMAAGVTSHAATMLTEKTYEDIRQNFSTLCLGKDTLFPSYKSSQCPSLASFRLFAQLYLDNFDVVMPIMHERVTQTNDHWILALAICAIGCQYAEADEFSQAVAPLHEFLRRATLVESANYNFENIGRDKQGVALAQAMTLSQIGMLYSGSPQLLHHAKMRHGALVAVAHTIAFEGTTQEPVQIPKTSDVASDIYDESWRKLMFEECKRRIGYAIWILDCMSAYHFRQQPLMPINLSPVSLPNDKLWKSMSPSEFASSSAPSQDIPSLAAATASLFREKQLTEDLGQFSHVILLHGVFREIFQLKDCFARPLGDWVPSIQQVTQETESHSRSACTSGYDGELLSSWRNAALDCVDVLHWAANGTIARQAGAEHATVLHLHLSRTVLLAPYNRFQTLADSIVSSAQGSASRALCTTERQNAIEAERDIIEWAQRDQCKARLAVLHSGCLFWHIRRYSVRAFYEPTAVFLATLTIWAYSSYASRSSGSDPDSETQPGHDTQDEASRVHDGDEMHDTHGIYSSPTNDCEPAPTFIHLDRPNDDEMVQVFVRFGTSINMQANITGVGDIYSAKGPARILKEGRKILAAVSTAWGRSEKMVSMLDVLEQVASGRVTLGTGGE